MMERTVKVVNGLESRSAAIFVQTASKFGSSLKLTVDNKTINAKSIMGIISLGVLPGQEVTLVANGDDEKQALEQLTEILLGEEDAGH